MVISMVKTTTIELLSKKEFELIKITGDVRRLVEESRVCVCHLGKKTGGTAYTVRYARQKGLTVINLFP